MVFRLVFNGFSVGFRLFRLKVDDGFSRFKRGSDGSLINVAGLFLMCFSNGYNGFCRLHKPIWRFLMILLRALGGFDGNASSLDWVLADS